MVGRVLFGVVSKKSSSKTVKVLVTRKIKHSLYGKFLNVKKYYLVHDQDDLCNVGDLVKIKECSPISKKKKWIFLGF